MLGRQLVRELRPFFRMLDEPLTRAPALLGPTSQSRFPVEHSFFGARPGLRPAVDVLEEGDKYIVEAELPGVKKEDVGIHIGDGGRSITIEGKAYSRSRANTGEPVEGSDSATPIFMEREFSGNGSFVRTITLPEPVEGSKVSAKLQDGVLVLAVPKAEDKGRVTVNVE